MKFLIAPLLLLLPSCQSTWDTYEISSHQTIAAPGPESYEAHVSHLTKKVEGDAPPPGLCAEMAYFLVLLGRPGEADVLFAREVDIWPQSEKFVLGLRRSLGIEGPLVSQANESEATQ